MKLVDKYLPEFHFSEYHEIKLAATGDRLYERLVYEKNSASFIMKFLFLLRGIPTKNLAIADFPKLGFAKLEEVTGEEILFATVSSDCRFSTCLDNFTPEGFLNNNVGGPIRAVIDFRLNSRNDEYYLSTETRVHCRDTKSKRKFRIYWFFVSPFSKLIRILMLREMRKRLKQESFNKPASALE